MIQEQNSVVGVLTYVNQTLATATSTNVQFQIDTRAKGKKWDHLRVIVQPKSGTAGQAVKLLALALVESDDTNASNFSNISGYVGTTNSTAAASEFVIPVGNTTGTDSPGALHTLDLPLNGRKRYIGVKVTPANATSNSVHAVYQLSRGDAQFLDGNGSNFVGTGTGVHVTP